LGLLIPLIVRYRDSAERARCLDHLRLVAAFALHDYYVEKHKEFPAGTVVVRDLPPEKRLSWVVPLLTRLHRADLERTIDQTAPWDAPVNASAAKTLLTFMVCPSRGVDPRSGVPAPSHYPGIAGVGADAATLRPGAPRAGVFLYDAPTPLGVLQDGLSGSLLLLETSAGPGPWIAGGPATVRPVDPATKPYLGVGRPFGGNHPGGANAAFADGSARFLTDRISPDVLELLAAVADGEQ
jgi:prepilin-type processing-associated H-X9-DG protein